MPRIPRSEKQYHSIAQAVAPVITHGCYAAPISALLRYASALAEMHGWTFNPAKNEQYCHGGVSVKVTRTTVIVSDRREYPIDIALRRSRADGADGERLWTMLASWSVSAGLGMAWNTPTAISMESKAAEASARLAAIFAASGAEFSSVHVYGTGDVRNRRVCVNRLGGTRYGPAPAAVEAWVDSYAPRYRLLRTFSKELIADSPEGKYIKRSSLDPVSIMRLVADMPQAVVDAVADMVRVESER